MCFYQGVVIFHDVFDNEYNVGGAQIKIEGVYIWPFRQLRMVANRWTMCISNLCDTLLIAFRRLTLMIRTIENWSSNTKFLSVFSYCSGKDGGGLNQDGDYILSNPYHLVLHLSWCIIHSYFFKYNEHLKYLVSFTAWSFLISSIPRIFATYYVEKKAL